MNAIDAMNAETRAYFYARVDFYRARGEDYGTAVEFAKLDAASL